MNVDKWINGNIEKDNKEKEKLKVNEEITKMEDKYKEEEIEEKR